MAVGVGLRLKDIPRRYKFNPYFDLSGKAERKTFERKLRHAVKIFLKKEGK